jgi:hypothetical protein
VSFDIFYQPCRFGAEPVEQKNPFTGEVQTVLPVKPLTTGLGVGPNAGATDPGPIG